MPSSLVFTPATEVQSSATRESKSR